jgi:hypothetical protein
MHSGKEDWLSRNFVYFDVLKRLGTVHVQIQVVDMSCLVIFNIGRKVDIQAPVFIPLDVYYFCQLWMMAGFLFSFFKIRGIGHVGLFPPSRFGDDARLVLGEERGNEILILFRHAKTSCFYRL